MSPSRLPQVPAPALPPLVAAYVKATNSFDLDGLLAAFADDALVNDQLRDYWGKSAIREWAARDIIGERLTMHVVKIMEHYGHFILTANIDGNYDKRGLPDPLASPFTSQPTAIKSFSSSFFEISLIFEKSHQLLQSRSMDCGSDCPEVQHKSLRAKVTIYTALQH